MSDGRRRSRVAFLAGVLFAWGGSASGCQVDEGFLDDDLFPCDVGRDCGEGWGCVKATPYASDFCAPQCDETSCDGVCTQQDGQALCLRGCRIHADGTASDCGGRGFECIRVSAERSDGVCYPVTPCEATLDCGEGELCLSELVAVSPGAASARYYCVPQDVGAGCPARSRPIDVGTAEPLCLATCNPPDTRCPPGFGCLEQAALFTDGDVLCFPGIYGVPCDDDTNCLLGRCLDTGAGRQCSVSCDEAARLAGGCAALPNLAGAVGALAFECDPAANDGVDGGLCVTRSGLGFICTTPQSDAYTCEDGLDCHVFPTGGGEVRICTRECANDHQCNQAPGGTTEAYCLTTAAGSFCLPKLPDGAECLQHQECASGRCEAARCAGDEL